MEDSTILTTHHDPGKFVCPPARLQNTQCPAQSLIVLNSPIASIGLLKRVWAASQQIICADGGANRVFDLTSGGSQDESGKFIPDYITGDLDSLDPQVRRHYESQRVSILFDADQYSTDFGKSVKLALDKSPHGEEEMMDIIILGSMSGRVDQGLGLLSEIAREQSAHQIRFWLVSERSVSFILQGPPKAVGRNQPDVHRHIISLACKSDSESKESAEAPSEVEAGARQDKVFTPNVGILPIFGPARISTRGLEWDVSDWPTEMGANVSTSNHVKEPQVEVKTNAKVLFTIEMSDFDSS
ncbi:MAG: hypothetical protein M1831_003197 [Alyxoria varia]|nr:MAG: hypothetical protein M1831_003197 [Alyxoria varia]